jgi:hypothetical protein
MWLLVELIIVPVLIVLWIIMSSLAANFGIGPLLLGLTLNLLLFLVVGAILRFLWRIETDEGIHDEAHSK